MLIGYARCSTADQNLDWQLDALKENGCERIYQEKVTGTKKERPELNRMLDALRNGDTVLVCELTRLSRSTKDLFELVERISACGAGISQFERDLTHERTMDGLAAARARGRLGGRPRTDEKKIQQALAMYDANNIPIKDILETTGISRASLYSYLRARKKQQPSRNTPVCCAGAFFYCAYAHVFFVIKNFLFNAY